MPAGAAGLQIFYCLERSRCEAHEGGGIMIPAPGAKNRRFDLDFTVEDNGDHVTLTELGILGDEGAPAEADIGNDRRRVVGHCGKTNRNSPVLAPIFPRGTTEFVFNRHCQVPVERSLVRRP